MNFLDMKTVFFSQFLIFLVGLGAITAFWYGIRKKFPGLSLWVADYVFMTIGTLLIFLRAQIPDLLSFVVGNTLVITGAWLMLLGLERFLNKNGPQVHNVLYLVCFVSIHSYFTFVHPDLTVRGLNSTSGILVMSFQSLWLLLYRVEPGLRAITRGTGLVFGGYSVLCFYRIIYLLTHPAPPDFFKSSGEDTFLVLIFLMLFVMLTYNLILMVSRRLQREVLINEEEIRQLNDDLEQRVDDRTAELSATIEALRDSEERWRRITATAQDAIIMIDNEGKITYWNEAAERILGYKKKEVLGGELHTLLAPKEYHQDFQKGLLRFRETGQGPVIDKTLELPALRKDGTVFPIELSVSAVKLKGQWHALGIMRDITERKETEKELSLGNTIIANMKEGVYLIRTRDGMIVHTNPQLERMFGYPPGEMVGQNVSIVNAPTNKSPEEIAREIIASLHQKNFWQGEVLNRKKDGTNFWSQAGVSTFEHPEYGTVWIAVHQDITERKKAEEELRIHRQHLEELVQERTKELEAEINERNQAESRQILMVKILSILNSPLTFTDTINRILLALKKDTNFDAIGIRLQNGEDYPYHVQKGFSSEFIDAENRLIITDRKGDICRDKNGKPSLECTCGLVISGKTDFNNPLFTPYGSFWTNNTLPLLDLPAEEDPRLHPRNRCIHEGFLSVALIPIHIDQEIVGLLQLNDRKRDQFTIQMIQFFEGITASIGIMLMRRQAEDEIRRLNEELEERVRNRTAQLEAANKDLESFSYSVSHDLRAPLRSIDGFSLALLEDYSTGLDETGTDYLHRIRKATQKMGLLIDDLLKLSRISRQEMNYQPVNLSRMIENIYETLQQNDFQREVDVIIAEDLKIQADPYLLKIALTNLLENAWKFTGRTNKTQIEFGTISNTERRTPNTERIFFIKDNGVGFDMAYADKLFQPFQRLHGPEEFPGTGIGLATVKRIINRHGGQVWAEGEVGKGAVFYFTLP